MGATATHNDLRYCESILNAIPSPVLVVDQDLRVVYLNDPASAIIDNGMGVASGQLPGELFKCINSVSVGCGKSSECQSCKIRNSAIQALSGEGVIRVRLRMQIVKENSVVTAYFVVSTAPFKYNDERFALIILEDISHLMEIREYVPVCSWCKKIRDDKNYWKTLEAYLEKQLDVQMTHGICPECASTLLEPIKK